MTDRHPSRLDRRADPIFVGYLPTPLRDHAFLLRVVPILFVIAAVVAAGLSADQRTPGDGVWDLENVLELEGELVPGPYPLLRVADPDATGGVRTWLLVEEGKFGPQPRVDRLGIERPTAVLARGHLIERDGRRMLELLGGDDGLVPAVDPAVDMARPAPATVEDLGPRSLRGEIVDGKCWLGVMKPGAGKTHKACATLCIDGGVPPLLVWLDDEGIRRRTLVVGSEGEAVIARIRDVIADPVVLTGVLSKVDDLEILRLDPGDRAVVRTR